MIDYMIHRKSNYSIGAAILLAAILGLGFSFALLTVFLAMSVAFESVLPQIRLFAGNHGLATGSSILLASPILASVFLFGAMPLTAYGSKPVPTDFLIASVIDSLNDFWPQVAGLLVLSALLAIWCFFRHRRYEDRGAVLWGLFVLFMGLPGLVGYLLHRRWPPMEVCRHCNRQSPRDRDACLHCQTPFPPPAMKGIEIFA